MYFDILMPALLFSVTLVAIFLGKRAEAKVQSTLEERTFGNKETALFIVMIVAAVSVVTFIPNMAILAFFLFSYVSLLFTVSYTYSDMRPKRAILYCGLFIAASALAAIASLLGVVPPDVQPYALTAFTCLAACSLGVLVHIQRRSRPTHKWYVAALSPALFLLLFIFFNGTQLWFPYLLDVYGLLFAILIIIYLSPMFNWKILFAYAAAITVMDIILVWGPGHLMIQAANTLTSMNLPVLVWFPNVPPLFSSEGILILHGLGLGDLFFSGSLSFQTLKKFGTKTTVISLAAIAISFGLFELMLMNPELADILPIKALPATLPILLGWLPVIGARLLISRRQQPKPESAAPLAQQWTLPQN
ncbi:MAG: hypothetical protein NWF05_05670 [Candidatus Bathyarchaeota archaeon]|nr:hypothetical protein [Candidatus Bathyarchaeota archaeon]